MVFQNNVLGGASNSAGTTGYTIDQSIRFNNNDTAYMKRTPSSSGNQRTWTLSMWVKRGELGNYGLFGTRTANTTNFFAVEFNSDDLFVQGYASSSQTLRFETNAHFRDPSAWYHVVLVADTTNANSSDRIKIYVNGERVTSFATATYPTQNYDTHINSSSYENAIGCHNTGSDRVFSGYMTDIVMLDGTAADPSSFGETNSNGIWVPKDVSGLTFGTNGFHIDGRDASDLGDDESGQGNDYTTVNLATHDQVFDTPTNNFCVMNPVSKLSYDSGVTIRGVSGVNLSSISKPSGNTNGFAHGTMGVKSGKWYYELYTTTYPAVEALGLGWIDAENAQTATTSGSGWRDFGINQRHTTSAYSVWQWGYNESTGTGLTEFQASVVVGVATDFDNNTFTLTTNGSAYGSVDFDSTSPTQDLTDGTVWLPKSVLANDAVALVTFNFGQDSTFNGQISAGGNSDANEIGNFKYSVPSGYLALCSKNLGAD